MIERANVGTTIKINYGKSLGFCSYSNIAHNASDDNILKFAKAINSLQTKAAEKYTKVSTYELTSM